MYTQHPILTEKHRIVDIFADLLKKKNVSGYVCNHGSPSGERDTASPRGRYGERPQRDSVWRYIWKNTTCWPATAHDVTTGVPQYKCRREDTSSASSSEACVRSMAQSPGDAVSRSPLGEPWLHTYIAKKASTKPTIPGLRKFPPGRLMAVSDIIPFGQRPELRTLVLTC